MTNNFATIKHYDDVKECVDDNYIVKDTEEYKVISYILPTSATFPDKTTIDAKIRREFRGIIFCNKTGKIIRRPLEKFFNLGERQSITLEKLSDFKEASIFEKLDGSMIAFFRTHSGKLIAGTKMGETDISPYVDKFLEANPNYVKFVEMMLLQNKTPIFEWLDSCNNKIVLDYGTKPRLVLLAVRDLYTGEYEQFGFLQNLAHLSGVEIVRKITDKAFSEDFINFAKSQKDEEGHVVRFENGLAVKIKNDWYVNVHRAKSNLCDEKNVVKLVLTNSTDDLKPLLEPENVKALEEFELSLVRQVHYMVNTAVENLQIIKSRELDKKTLALTYKDVTPSWLMSMLFTYHGKDIETEVIFEHVVEFILKYCDKKRKYQENLMNGCLKDIVRWKPLMFFTTEDVVVEDDDE